MTILQEQQIWQELSAYLDIALDLEGEARESWLKEVEARSARMAAEIRRSLAELIELRQSFLRLQRVNPLVVNDSRHFLAYAATTMRSVIVDYVRQRKTAPRGGAEHVTLHTGLEPADASDDEILDVHEALEVLVKVDARLAKVVEMRYFGGLADVEIARALGVTERTVRRDWDRARLLLAALLER